VAETAVPEVAPVILVVSEQASSGRGMTVDPPRVLEKAAAAAAPEAKVVMIMELRGRDWQAVSPAGSLLMRLVA